MRLDRIGKFMRVTAFAVPPGGGETIQGPVGGTRVIKARTEITGGTFTLLQNTVALGQGPRRHVHAREDEMWYVLECTLRFIADGEIFQASSGAFERHPTL